MVFLLDLIVKVIFQESVLFDKVFLVAGFSLVLVLAGSVHVFYLVLELREHEVRPVALPLCFLGAVDFDSGDVLCQSGNRLLLGGY